MDECDFLGAEILARLVYVIDSSASKSYMTRQEYNEVGPSAIHDYKF